MRWIRCVGWGLAFICCRVVWLFVIMGIMGATQQSGPEYPLWVQRLGDVSFFDIAEIQSFAARFLPENAPNFLTIWLIFWETFAVGFLGAAAVQAVIGRVKWRGADGSRPVTITGIPSSVYEQIITDLDADGWECRTAYAGFDAGIDYDCVTLKKQGQTLKFEWELYFEGNITGPEGLLAELKEAYLESGVGENKQ